MCVWPVQMKGTRQGSKINRRVGSHIANKQKQNTVIYLVTCHLFDLNRNQSAYRTGLLVCYDSPDVLQCVDIPKQRIWKMVIGFGWSTQNHLKTLGGTRHSCEVHRQFISRRIWKEQKNRSHPRTVQRLWRSLWESQIWHLTTKMTMGPCNRIATRIRTSRMQSISPWTWTNRKNLTHSSKNTFAPVIRLQIVHAWIF